MVSLRREGFTVNEIAERVGFHRTTVSKHLKRAGLKLRTDVSDESFQQRVRQVYAETGTIKGTAKKLGVSKGTVRKVLRATHHPLSNLLRHPHLPTLLTPCCKGRVVRHT